MWYYDWRWNEKQIIYKETACNDSWFKSDQEWEAYYNSLSSRPIEKKHKKKKEKTVHTNTTKNKDNFKSKMCKYGSECKRSRTTCTFAHNSKELVQIKCTYGNKCRYKNSTCKYVH